MPGAKSILILGGTAESRELAARLVALGYNVTTSLAGVTSSPLLPLGKLRKGGFGGADGLVDYLLASRTDTLIDATHSFAAQMSRHAFEAAQRLGLLLLRLERPEWQPQGGEDWIVVTSMDEAASALPQQARVFVTTGRKNLDVLFARSDLAGVIRVVEPLQETLPTQWAQILDRPPYQVTQEQALIESLHITHLVTKNAGGDSTSAKLAAARLLKLPVVMLRRPAKPICPTFASVDEMIAMLGRGDIGG